MKIIEVAFHRNGISGNSFHAVIFDDEKEGRMIGTLFDEPGSCAIYKIEELTKNNISFGMGNSWRGDYYESILRAAIKEYEEKR